MSVMTAEFIKNIFGSGKARQEAAALSERIPRRSTGFQEFMKGVAREQDLFLLDLGPTSAANIRHITEMGHRIYNEDVLSGANSPDLKVPSEEPGHEGQMVIDVDRFFAENMRHDREKFDAVLCWDIPDYLPEDLVKPVISQLHTAMKKGGVLLAFFHTRDAGPEEPYYRYHILDRQTIELQRGPRFRLQRVFNNRHIENLFHDFSSIKFFLGRDNIREVLVIR